MSFNFQTSYSQRPGEALPGMLASAVGPERRTTRLARGLVKAGYGVFKVPGTGSRGGNLGVLDSLGECFHIPSPAPAADVDAIVDGGLSTTGTDLAAAANGVVGSADIQPARQLTVTFDASTDWDATVGVLTYLDHEGRQVSENIAIATSTSVTTTGYASKYVSFTKPAQTGATGTYDIGVAVLATLALGDFLGVALRIRAKTTLSTSDLYRRMGGNLSSSVSADYIDNEEVRIVKAGSIWVFTEEAVSDQDPVYVRIAAGAGGSVLGAFRNDADTASCVAVSDARFVRNAAAGVAWIELGAVR